MRSVLVALVVLALVAGAAWHAPAGEEQMSASRLGERCEGARRAPESAGRGPTPVLLVHGFLGSPGDFRRGLLGARDDDRATMLEGLARVEGVTVYTFDYSGRSSMWVTDPGIAPALAESIRCLERAAGRQVVVVAHSMGGLATRVAQGEVLGGEPVATSVAEVVTIGTPTRGVLLLTYTSDEVSAFLVQQVIDGAGRLCADPPARERRRLCELLDAADAPATGAMAPGSRQLDALPPWDRDVVVFPIATDLRLRLSAFGVGTTVSLGDIVATVDSATAGASRGVEPLVVRCRITLTELVEAVDRSPCAHGTELANRRVIRAVRARVRAAAASPQEATRSSRP